MVKPVSKGRKKIEIRKIQNRSSLGVTFTKRRNGIFKKANELVTLCAAELAILIFSPGKKVYSFGHPDVYSILNRILHHFTNSCDLFTVNGKDRSQEKVQNLVSKFDAVQKQTEMERTNSREEKKASNATVEIPPKSMLNYEQSLQLHAMMSDLKVRVSNEIQRRIFMEYANLKVTNPNILPVIFPDNNNNNDNCGVLGFDNLGSAPGEGAFLGHPNGFYEVGSSSQSGANHGGFMVPNGLHEIGSSSQVGAPQGDFMVPNGLYEIGSSSQVGAPQGGFMVPNGCYEIGSSSQVGAPEPDLVVPNGCYEVGSSSKDNAPDVEENEQFKGFGVSGDISTPSANYGTWEF